MAKAKQMILDGIRDHIVSRVRYIWQEYNQRYVGYSLRAILESFRAAEDALERKVEECKDEEW